ncbi:tRNA (cytosine(49)-C(5))-methyltransferase [Candidatus Bilamarchaeum dharawalense]|uniref:tRNA (Cytosine(49)-C(5))-methyltransferase n=1 Tax=Candidatus Bilamarchaeum dharawalense TaxID=2885759 RepID=A0A5E4LM18_9ARCH|nr:tRNA (cytosine(49)-C(5))-methyltransferase [Candidatus Bilamarchaeum dharawalense]
MDSIIPEKFKERYCQLVDDPDKFLSTLMQYTPRSFRVNRLKATVDEIKERFDEYGIAIKQMSWYGDAFVSENPEIGATLEHFLGMIYIQEIVSMLPPVIMQKELKQAKFVLDGCAAPGSKTTQMAAIMQNNGTIIANDLAYGRIRALKFNIEKTGTLNTIITNRDLRTFPNYQFDAILLDAPCSAEGTMRKNMEVFSTWNEREIQKQCRVQKPLILKAFDLLAPGGVMVYSTCTFAPEENEGVVDWLLKNRPNAKLEKIAIDGFKLSSAIEEWNGEKFDSEITKTARVWPHHNDTGGFFLARVTK